VQHGPGSGSAGSGRGKRVPRELREALVQRLRRDADPITIADAARVAGVSARMVRKWREDPGGPVGRPGYPPAVRLQVLRIVLRIWSALAPRAGWRTVQAAAGWMLPTRLVQESLRRIKHIYAARVARGRARRRVSVEVLATNVLWHQDATHLGRTPDGVEVQGQAVRDAAAPVVLVASVGRAVTAQDALRALEASIAMAGAAPLALGTDNGPPFTEASFVEELRKRRIVHLRNLPHTPQHNSRGERPFRDWKEDEELGRGVVLPDLQESARRVARACAAQERLAQVRAVPVPPPVRYNDEQRARFYEAVCQRIEAAVQGARNPRAERLAERAAIFAALEEEELIVRTRGGAPLVARDAETIT